MSIRSLRRHLPCSSCEKVARTLNEYYPGPEAPMNEGGGQWGLPKGTRSEVAPGRAPNNTEVGFGFPNVAFGVVPRPKSSARSFQRSALAYQGIYAPRNTWAEEEEYAGASFGPTRGSLLGDFLPPPESPNPPGTPKGLQRTGEAPGEAGTMFSPGYGISNIVPPPARTHGFSRTLNSETTDVALAAVLGLGIGAVVLGPFLWTGLGRNLSKRFFGGATRRAKAYVHKHTS